MRYEHTDDMEAIMKQIERQAKERQGYLLWLADKLEQTNDPLIRKDAADAIRWLLGVKQ